MPGGSSSGEAAIIAVGGSPLGLGSDSGGSIRWPAHCCGIAGLKPTNGLVPTTGHVPCISALADPRTTIGPMARTVGDLRLTLSLIAGVDGQDAGVAPMPLGDAREVDIKALRVAYFTAFEGASASAEVAEVVAAVIRTLEGCGIDTRPACPPRIEESLPITRAYWARPESISLHRWRPWHTSTLSADEVERSIFEWDRLRRSFLRFMQEFDLLVCPAAPYPAPARTASLDDDYIYTLPYSLTGYPCVVIRAGTSSENLPIGVQMIARPWHDHVALAAAEIVESELGGWQQPPL